MLRHALLALNLLLVPAPLWAGAAESSLNVLFLGDGGHHRPADRAAQLVPVLAGRGIAVTYTERVADLNPTNLARYDALIVYANIDEIAADREKALLAYVEGGGGFVPIHCASYCFRNSPAYVALVGAQFLRHGTGEFDTRVVDAEHPVMRGLSPFRTWDETYVHKGGTPDRHVLQVRAEGKGEEPWTWVRNQGKGRVFYTAYGHDARTWGHPGFHDLIERGVRWASGKGAVYDGRPRVKPGLAPFAYEETKAKIPNYLAGERWGTMGAALNRLQEPLPPGESARHLAMPAGFRAELFAAEPEIAKPVAMAWDHRGRLWIAETTDYPNDRQPTNAGHDRIKICEDTDGDGRADRFTVFADRLSIPTSLAFSDGGVVVHQAPDTLFLKDVDGDDRADERKVLLHGWGTQDTHAGPSNLRYGLDNRLWGMVGYSGFQGTAGGESLEFRQGFFRFKPDGSGLEFLRSTNNNSWGVGFSEEGVVFGSTANGCPSVYLPIANRYYESVRGWAPSVLANIADSNRFFPITEKVRQVDCHGGFTAASGHALYTARTYPRHYWNRTAFVSEPTGHLTATFALVPRGADFASHNLWNLVASDDEWTAPIAAEVGPDGQVWVIDWYNYIVQHNPTPQGFETGKGNAYVTPLRDKTHGRIYRIVAEGGRPSPAPALDPRAPATLLAGLRSENMLWRSHAQRLLVERGRRDVAPELIALIVNPDVDAIGLNPAAIHALWTLHGLGLFDGDEPDPKATAAALSALRHPSAGVRRNALMVLPRRSRSSATVVEAASAAVADPDAQVRLAAFLAIAELAASDAAARAVATAIASGRVAGDRWLEDAATAAAAAHDRPFLAAIARPDRSGRPPAPALLAIAARVAEHYGRGGPVGSVGGLLEELGDGEPKVLDAIVIGLARGWPANRRPRLTDPEEAALVRLLPGRGAEAQGPLVGLANRWGSRGLERHTAEIARALLETARDPSKSDATRATAARQLIEFRASDPAAAGDLLDLITPRTSPELASGLIDAVARSASPGVGAALVERLKALTPTVRSQALRVLLGRPEWTASFLDGVERGAIALSDLPLDQKQALAAHPDRTLATRAKTLLERAGGGLPDPDRQKVIDSLGPVVLRSGDAAKGKLVFQQQCAKCHKHGGEGQTIGPDLSGMAAHPKAELLTNILDPSRSVEGNFVQYTVVTNEGRILSGLLATETRTAIELIDTEGKTHRILRADIDELAASKKSLMPEGFEKQVPPGSIADLLEFLTSRGKYLPLDLRKVATVDSTHGMFYSKDAVAERLVFPDWTPKTFNDVPFVLVDPKAGKVPNAILLYGPQGTIPPQMPKSVSLPCNAPARAIHLLSGVSGWGATGPGASPTVSMIVRLHYEGGNVEDHPLENGVEFADYIRRVDVPGSKLAFLLRGRQQVRYLAVHPKRPATIERIELVKGPDATAPIVLAVTVEVGGG